jgi:hypothetical protein
MLLVVHDLPRGRMPRVGEFSQVEARLEPHLEEAKAKGVTTRLSPILLSPEEVLAKGPPFVDMALETLVLYDREGFFANLVKRVRRHLEETGARHVEAGGGDPLETRPVSRRWRCRRWNILTWPEATFPRPGSD